MVPGRYGLLLVTFSLLVWLAKWLDIADLRSIDFVWLQIIGLLFCLGLASCIVGVLGRYWAVVRRPE